MNSFIEVRNISLKNLQNSKKYSAQLTIIKQESQLTENDLKSFLSDEELLFYDNIDNSSTKQSYFYGRKAAKKALLAITEIRNPQEISIRNGIYGQPVICGNRISGIQVSISHSKHYAAGIAFFEECPMAVDIEEISKTKEESVKSQMTRHEIINVIPKIDGNYGNLCLWTAKEALSKVIRTGLQIDFSLLEVEQVNYNSKVIEGSFTNFIQYKFLSCCSNDFIYSIVFPKTLIFNQN